MREEAKLTQCPTLIHPSIREIKTAIIKSMYTFAAIAPTKLASRTFTAFIFSQECP